MERLELRRKKESEVKESLSVLVTPGPTQALPPISQKTIAHQNTCGVRGQLTVLANPSLVF